MLIAYSGLVYHLDRIPQRRPKREDEPHALQRGTEPHTAGYKGPPIWQQNGAAGRAVHVCHHLELQGVPAHHVLSLDRQLTPERLREDHRRVCRNWIRRHGDPLLCSLVPAVPPVLGCPGSQPYATHSRQGVAHPADVVRGSSPMLNSHPPPDREFRVQRLLRHHDAVHSDPDACEAPASLAEVSICPSRTVAGV